MHPRVGDDGSLWIDVPVWVDLVEGLPGSWPTFTMSGSGISAAFSAAVVS